MRLERLGITLWRRECRGLSDRGPLRPGPGQKFQADLWGVDEIGGTARHWEIETKRPGNRPTPGQLEWLKAMSARGCVAFWVGLRQHR